MRHIFSRPITSRAQADAFFDLLGAAGLCFHPDDDPRTVINAQSGARIFDDREADLVRERIAEAQTFFTDIYRAMMRAEDRTRPAAPALSVMGTGGGCEALYRYDKARGLSALVTNDLCVPRPGEFIELGLYADEHYEECAAWFGSESHGAAYVNEAHAAQLVEAAMAYWAAI